MLANRSSTIVAERDSGKMTYATKKPFAEHDLRVTLQRAGNNGTFNKFTILATTSFSEFSYYVQIAN